MPQTLVAFARLYRQAILDLLDTIPEKARNFVPPCVEQTSFVLAITDPSGRVAVEFRGRDRYPKLKINGYEALPENDHEPGFLGIDSLSKLETIIFPGTSASSSATWRLSGNVALHSLTFASREFSEANTQKAFHAQFIGEDVPFEVLGDGSVLAVNVVSAFLLEGSPEIKVTEWLRVFGSADLVPSTENAIRELAITDLSSAALKLSSAQQNWSFSQFLSSLQAPVDSSVLLLGSYSNETSSRFDETRVALEQLGYTPFLLKDSPDLPIQKNQEKLFAAVMFSSFIVVIDDHPSGHLAEMATLMQFRFRPIIVLRRSERPSTSFLEDGVLTDDTCRVEVISEITATRLTPAISWARQWLSAQKRDLNAINSWRETG